MKNLARVNIDKMNVVLEDQGCGNLPGVVVSPVEEGHQQHGEQTRNLVSRRDYDLVLTRTRTM